ncbi:MAG: hypothetical protein WBM54_10560 [Woeseia sp.]
MFSLSNFQKQVVNVTAVGASDGNLWRDRVMPAAAANVFFLARKYGLDHE